MLEPITLTFLGAQCELKEQAPYYDLEHSIGKPDYKIAPSDSMESGFDACTHSHRGNQTRHQFIMDAPLRGSSSGMSLTFPDRPCESIPQCYVCPPSDYKLVSYCKRWVGSRAFPCFSIISRGLESLISCQVAPPGDTGIQRWTVSMSGGIDIRTHQIPWWREPWACRRDGRCVSRVAYL